MKNPTLFEQARRVFPGWTDPHTGLTVLRLAPPGEPTWPRRFATPYHQQRPFLDGGRWVLLREYPPPDSGPKGYQSILIDLTTGRIERPFPPGAYAWDVDATTGLALINHSVEGWFTTSLFDITERRIRASLALEPNWQWASGTLLTDGRRAILSHYQGRFYDEPCRSHFHRMTADQDEAPIIFELDGIFANHLVACPADPDLFAYNAWPTPKRDVEGVTAVATPDGRLNRVIALAPQTPRPGNFYAVRDHYVWTPDGRRIVSYFSPEPIYPTVPFNHFLFDWWISALDWRTGEDLFARYPPGRWGGHIQVTPDSRYILAAGGPGYDWLYAIAIDEMKQGWNEHRLCRYPPTHSKGTNGDPFPYPFALPDGSGVLFNAGWPGPDHGLYLAEWPCTLTPAVRPAEAVAATP